MAPGIGLGIGLGKYHFPIGAGSPAPTFLLDTYPGAAAAYSLEQLSSTTTNVVRVRRSSDNAEADFTATEITDGTLTTWTGANDGFVVTWYDQSGNARNVSQSTAGRQPRIVASGVLETENGIPALAFNSASFHLLVSTDNFATAQPITTISVFNQTSSGAHYITDNASRLVLGEESETALFGMYAGTWVRKANTITGSQNLSFALFSGINSEHYINGATWQNGNAGTAGITTSFTIGARNGGTSVFWNGTIQEIIIWPSDQSANRAAIETEINSRYSIYGSSFSAEFSNEYF